ncbi:hypothetical protein CC2G_004240 [Coprinopsis cinerea AmutBmut pab1-1]|nr:hypothetical protein CC2G_004240 [Coprinopsis cinerea AmutBmut pab1-1]
MPPSFGGARLQPGQALSSFLPFFLPFLEFVVNNSELDRYPRERYPDRSYSTPSFVARSIVEATFIGARTICARPLDRSKNSLSILEP